MSWDSIQATQNLISIQQNHKLSATRLLASPDGSRHPLDDNADADLAQFNGSFSRLAGYDSSPDDTSLCPRETPKSRCCFVLCFASCNRRMQQYFARRKIQRGLRLYEQHNQVGAVKLWLSAIKATDKREDLFELLGYLYQGHMDWGKYREASEYSYKQLIISEELDAPSKRAEAYLNLARSQERLGGLERALNFARHSLYNECGTPSRNTGLVHLTVARVYLEMGGFTRAMKDLKTAHKISAGVGDPRLQLQVYVTLSELFDRLQDGDKSARYASKAYDLSRSLQLGDLNTSHHRAALLRMASALRKQGELGDAHDYCTEALRMSVASGDQATQNRSIRILGDIFRKKNDIQRAFYHYQKAMGKAAAVCDRIAQMEAMDGQARCLELVRVAGRICNCRPLEFNARLLEVAMSVGSNLLVRKIRARLALIYESLGDDDQHRNHTRLAVQADRALGLHCGVCDHRFGLERNHLEVLSCSHILHARCARELYRKRGEKGGSAPRSCPACNNLLASRTRLCDDDIDLHTLPGGQPMHDDAAAVGSASSPPSLIDARSANLDRHRTLPTATEMRCVNDARIRRSNLSLASLNLRASSMTINSECNATSSV